MSIFTNILQVNFESCSDTDHYDLYRMIKQLEDTGLQYFLDDNQTIYPQSVVEFFNNARVYRGTPYFNTHIQSKVGGTLFDFTEQDFARCFGLPKQGLTDLHPPADTKAEVSLSLSRSDEPVDDHGSKYPLRAEYQLLNDIIGRSILGKDQKYYRFLLSRGFEIDLFSSMRPMIIFILIVVILVFLGWVSRFIRNSSYKKKRLEAILEAKDKKNKLIAILQRQISEDDKKKIRLDMLQKRQLYELGKKNTRLDEILEDIMLEKPVKFTSEELSDFTNNYSTTLGSGGFGKVYSGHLPNGIQCAVKVLKGNCYDLFHPNRNLDKQTEEQFKAEVSIIGRTYHANLVRLYGFCYDKSTSALVYEYMKNGSLDRHLFDDSYNQAIEWEKLYQIAVGTAKGIAYLHEECPQRIIHYDIKPANILLDANFSPKVADFGLAKLCSKDQTNVTMIGYRGTPGYSAPELFLHNFPISYKCDVYSFGMLLFEILGRRKNAKVSSSSSSLDWFPNRVWEKYETGQLEDLTTSCKIEGGARECAERVAVVALWCVQDSPQTRPRMSAVVRMLEGGVEILPPPKPFGYLISLRAGVINSSINDSKSASSEGIDSYWYRNTTLTACEHEINIEDS
ncbi:PR5-like receptor kinase [Impatiens glandulifera]|uniref:PR5-like receptor kinase n=1 Tax=Impatiens glandulifera TaxID=253017 RepID=UPI001FB1379F|nr:PR5-like receptor kinase [Impatiens glandulifera]